MPGVRSCCMPTRYPRGALANANLLQTAALPAAARRPVQTPRPAPRAADGSVGAANADSGRTSSRPTGRLKDEPDTPLRGRLRGTCAYGESNVVAGPGWSATAPARSPAWQTWRSCCAVAVPLRARCTGRWHCPPVSEPLRPCSGPKPSSRREESRDRAPPTPTETRGRRAGWFEGRRRLVIRPDR
jgi:hypothetical protein